MSAPIQRSTERPPRSEATSAARTPSAASPSPRGSSRVKLPPLSRWKRCTRPGASTRRARTLASGSSKSLRERSAATSGKRVAARSLGTRSTAPSSLRRTGTRPSCSGKTSSVSTRSSSLPPSTVALAFAFAFALGTMEMTRTVARGAERRSRGAKVSPSSARSASRKARPASASTLRSSGARRCHCGPERASSSARPAEVILTSVT